MQAQISIGSIEETIAKLLNNIKNKENNVIGHAVNCYSSQLNNGFCVVRGVEQIAIPVNPDKNEYKNQLIYSFVFYVSYKIDGEYIELIFDNMHKERLPLELTNEQKGDNKYE
ncbi:hypothetical protein SPV2_gp38 [Sulfolobus polyhedral virus 2]|uniref:Uncharacterized protein n=1 Tax=Sulfolobus polyhedral virus 2 TaxID=2493125 RepID=A0A3S8NFI9_9VIRU|nr:hypothetical protein KM458_gp38 [Sulfolobus polyhedral virus 2]AZI76037.1 hypothetical protein SPV2_gp38 [Sulfolobus polyhedral virus 2]